MRALKQLAAALLFPALLAPVADASAAATLDARGHAPTLPVLRGKARTDYLSLEKGALEIPIEGPGRVSGYIKRVLPDGEAAEGTIRLSGIPELPNELSWVFRPSSKDALVGRDEAVSVGRKLLWKVPAGRWTLRIEGDAELLLLLRWTGPPQAPTVAGPSAKRAPKWRFRRRIGLGVRYDDNIVHYSDNLKEEFTDGPYMAWYLDPSADARIDFGKFRLKSIDDVILTPLVDLEARRRFFSIGETRFRAKYSYSRYLNNPIKDVKTLAVYLRQVLPGAGHSVEISYRYTPDKYIRELSDRPPYAPSDDPRPWVGFRFASNDFVGNYRRRLSKKLSMTLTLEDGHRFYNQPFLEQDLVENEIIGTLRYAPSRRWRASAVYGTARGWTRRHDTAEETPLASDDNDNSYTQDRYRADLRWSPGPGRLFDSIALRFQRRIAYFTSPKTLWDDPFHVGRQDVYDSIRLIVGRKLADKLGGSLSIDYTRRTLNSPYTGDISEGMDYHNLQIWMDFTYNW